MRLGLLCLLVIVPPSPGAEPPRPKAITDPQEREAILRTWEKDSKRLGNFGCRIEQTSWDPVYLSTQKTVLELSGRSPDLLRFLERDSQGNPKSLLLVTREELRLFHYTTQTEIVSPPRRKPPSDVTRLFGLLGAFELAVRNQSTLLVHLRPPDVRTRFRLDGLSQDDHHLYLSLRPREKEDRSQFSSLQVVLEKQGWKLRRVTFDHPDGSRRTWDFLQWQEGQAPSITLQTLSKDLPQGWKRLALPD